MSTHIDASGRRSVQSEAIVPGTPEQVWQAIATGPGVSSWFVPCTIEEREGGEVTASFGPGMDSTSTITAWNPPHSFSAGGSKMDPSGPVLATEWIVEARSGDTCVVRVVHSWFAETDEWDEQFESTESGWASFFRDLAIYLVHFNGQSSATFQPMAFSPDSQDEAWAKLTTALGLAGKAVGDPVASPEGAPEFSGKVNYLGGFDHPEALVLLDGPAPGIAHFLAVSMGGMVCLCLRVFFYGEGAMDAAPKEEKAWSEWVAENFPMPIPADA